MTFETNEVKKNANRSINTLFFFTITGFCGTYCNTLLKFTILTVNSKNRHKQVRENTKQCSRIRKVEMDFFMPQVMFPHVKIFQKCGRGRCKAHITVPGTRHVLTGRNQHLLETESALPYEKTMITYLLTSNSSA